MAAVASMPAPVTNDASSSYYEPTEPDASSTMARRRQDRAFYRQTWESGYPELQRLCRLPDQEKPHPLSPSPSSSWQLDRFLDLMMDKAATVRRLNARKKKGLPLQDGDDDDGDNEAHDADDADAGASVYSTDSIRVWKIRFRIIRALLPSVWRLDDEGNDEGVKEDVIRRWEDCVEELGDIDEPEQQQPQQQKQQQIQGQPRQDDDHGDDDTDAAAATRPSPDLSDSDVDVYEEVASRASDLPDALTRSMDETVYEFDSPDTKSVMDDAGHATTYERPTVHNLSSEPALLAMPPKTPLGTLVEEPPAAEVSPVSTRPASTIPSAEDVYATPGDRHAAVGASPPVVVVEAYADLGRYLASTRRIVSLAGPPSDNAEYSIIIATPAQEAALLRDAARIAAPSAPTDRPYRASCPRLQVQPTAESVSDEGDPFLNAPSPLSPASAAALHFQSRSPIERSVSPMERAASPLFPSEIDLESQFDLMARKLLRKVLVTPSEELDDFIADASARFSSQAVADLVLRRVAELVGIEGQAGQKATFIQKLRVATLQRTQSSMRMRPPSPGSHPLAELVAGASATTLAPQPTASASAMAMRPIVEHASTAPMLETTALHAPPPRSAETSRRASAISEGGPPLSPSRTAAAEAAMTTREVKEAREARDKDKDKDRPEGSESEGAAADKMLKQRPSFRNKFRDSWRKIGKQQG
jgi:hypothetical protein